MALFTKKNKQILYDFWTVQNFCAKLWWLGDFLPVDRHHVAASLYRSGPKLWETSEIDQSRTWLDLFGDVDSYKIIVWSILNFTSVSCGSKVFQSNRRPRRLSRMRQLIKRCELMDLSGAGLVNLKQLGLVATLFFLGRNIQSIDVQGSNSHETQSDTLDLYFNIFT